jgi:hypothetical protein
VTRWQTGCAGAQSRFGEMHRALLAAPKDLDDAGLLHRARTLSPEEDRFLFCLSEEPSPQILRDIAVARELSVTGTPTFLVGRRVSSDDVQRVRRIPSAKLGSTVPRSHSESIGMQVLWAESLKGDVR